MLQRAYRRAAGTCQTGILLHLHRSDGRLATLQVVLEEPDVEANSATKVAIIGDVHAMDLLTMLRRLPDSTYIQSAAWMQDDIHLALVLMRSSPGSAELQLYNSHTGRHIVAQELWGIVAV